MKHGCHPGKLQQITTQQRTVRQWSGDDRGGAGIELSCLSTIRRSVRVMRRNKSAQPPLSVRGQVLEKEKELCHGCWKLRTYSHTLV